MGGAQPMMSANDEGANQVKHFCIFVILLLVCVGWSLTSTQHAHAQATLESPQPGSFHSGSGVISGWACDADQIDIIFNDTTTFQAAYGTSRADTATVCGDSDNGFGLLFNWNLLGNGVHTVRALADGVEFGSATVTITSFGVEVLMGANGRFRARDWPEPGTNTILRWDEDLQNFVIEGTEEL